MSFDSELTALRERVVNHIAQLLPAADRPSVQLHAAMRHSAQDPGKCIRSTLLYASGKALGVAIERLDRLACALELVHTYSLIHDDLPAMDDDATRRGRAACHIAYGEATAILAGNALLLLALEQVATDRALSETERCVSIQRLCVASGSQGMAGGQQLDLELPGLQQPETEVLDEVYRLKTGCLIHAAVTLPLELISVDAKQKAAIDALGWRVGLAFQIRDDLIDIAQDGVQANGNTYPSRLGGVESQRRLTRLGEEAIALLTPFGERADWLRTLVQFIARTPS